MITILLAWINAKYKADYDDLLFITLLVDLIIIVIIAISLQGGLK